MKYAIIAAGEGSRLTKEGLNDPKPLVRVAGECLIDRLLRIFTDNDAEEIVVICREGEGADDPMVRVRKHLEQIEKEGLNGKHIPLRFIVKNTPSSMHSMFELSSMVQDSKFIATTVDTIFNEQDFASYVKTFTTSDVDALMGVTDYIDDEKPLYVATDDELHITGFLDADPDKQCHYISGGIYGLTPVCVETLQRCIESGQSRMRNFQRNLVSDGLQLSAHPFSKVLDIDHVTDIAKAEEFLTTTKK